MSSPERHEPLPGLAELPRWAWRRMGRAARVALVAALLAGAAALVALLPGIQQSKQERARSEQHERAERRARLIRRLEAEQRPRFARSRATASAGAAPERRLAARAELMDDLAAAVLADARGRVQRGKLDGPIRRVECEPFPRGVSGGGAGRDLTRRRGRYSCIAVTAEFGGGATSIAGVIGHTYRVRVDFETGRYAYCKVAGQAGPSREQLVTTPRACGGR